MSTCGIVYAAEFNGDASFLAAGDSAGKLALFDILKSAAVNSAVSLSTDSASSSQSRPASPCLSFQTDTGSIYALHSEKDLLACGVDNGLLFTSWSDIRDGKSRFQALQIDSPYLRNGHPNTAYEVNAIAGMSGGDRLFVAAGDGNAYSFSVDTLQQTQTFLGSGPRAYLHSIAMQGTRQQNVFLAVCVMPSPPLPALILALFLVTLFSNRIFCCMGDGCSFLNYRVPTMDVCEFTTTELAQNL